MPAQRPILVFKHKKRVPAHDLGGHSSKHVPGRVFGGLIVKRLPARDFHETCAGSRFGCGSLNLCACPRF